MIFSPHNVHGQVFSKANVITSEEKCILSRFTLSVLPIYEMVLG